MYYMLLRKLSKAYYRQVAKVNLVILEMVDHRLVKKDRAYFKALFLRMEDHASI